MTCPTCLDKDLIAARQELADLRAKYDRVRLVAQNLRCPDHMQDASNAWGCPGCVTQQREALLKVRVLLEDPTKDYTQQALALRVVEQALGSRER